MNLKIVRGRSKLIKRLSLSVLLFLSVVVCSGTCSAQYQMTEQELSRLETIFNQLEANNNALLTELSQSKQDLQTARQRLEQYRQDLQKLQAQLQELKEQSKLAKQELQTANNLLQKANEYLDQYAKEVKKEQTRLTWQRNLFAAAAIVLTVK